MTVTPDRARFSGLRQGVSSTLKWSVRFVDRWTVNPRLTTVWHDGHCGVCGGVLSAGATAWVFDASDHLACHACGPTGRRDSGEGSDGDLLENLADVGVLVLHDRSAPTTRGTIDHVVVATSGVWVIGSRYHAGKVVLRRGTDDSVRPLLFVGKHNATELVENLRWQTEAVRAALVPIGRDDTPVTGALCFTGAEWGWFRRPIRVGAMLVTWPEHLLVEIERTAVMGPAEIDLVGQHLNEHLLVKR